MDGQPLIGSGSLGSRVWSGPAISIIGIDVPSVEGSLDAVSPYARAKLNVRIHPEQDATEAQAAVVEQHPLDELEKATMAIADLFGLLARTEGDVA